MVRKPPDNDAQLARKRRLLSMLIRMVSDLITDRKSISPLNMAILISFPLNQVLLFGICWLPFNLLSVPYIIIIVLLYQSIV